MTRIECTPSQQKVFADFLEQRTKLLIEKKRRFMDTLERAGEVCKDDKYRDFRRKAEQTALALDAFRRTADRYVDYLRRKAAAGERYLGK